MCKYLEGYPLTDDNKNIVYIACVASKMKVL